ncbi:MAG TPA: redox-regulated ATPase YchF, partial [Dehalococcoidia bacterium]
MDVGIIGLPQAGKTTVFNAVTHGHAATGYGAGTEPNVGVVKVPDRRLWSLSELFHPKKTTPADLTFVDFPAGGAAFGPGGSGPGSRFLTDLGRMDGLVEVVRAFQSPEVPHPAGSVDPDRDIGSMDLELAFADLALIEKRLERLETQVRSAKPQEREQGERELALLRRLKAGLEEERPIRAQELTEDERRAIETYKFLTQKPLLVLLN